MPSACEATRQRGPVLASGLPWVRASHMADHAQEFCDIPTCTASWRQAPMCRNLARFRRMCRISPSWYMMTAPCLGLSRPIDPRPNSHVL